MDKIDLSVVIITKNEESNLERCLSSLPQGAEVIVLDSGSVDGTLDIAKRFQCKVDHRNFDHYSNQKNAAIEMATRSWILSIDADEELTADLVDEIEKVIKSPQAAQGYRLPRRLCFMGKQMRFGKNTNDFPIRLFRRSGNRFKGEIHEVVQVVDNQLSSLSNGFILHYSYKDTEDYLKRLNLYTSLVAKQYYEKGKSSPSPVVVVSRFVLEFILTYVLRLGFLDGKQGLYYSILSSIYSFVKYLKLVELNEVSPEIKKNL